MRLFATGNFTGFKKNVYFSVLVLPLNCFSHAVACKLRHLSYRGISFCKHSSKKFAAKPFRQSCKEFLFCLLVTPQALTRQTFLEVKKQVIITWCKVRIILKMLENFPKRTAREMCVYERRRQFAPMSCLL